MVFFVRTIMKAYNMLKSYVKNNPDNKEIKDIFNTFAEGIGYGNIEDSSCHRLKKRMASW